MAKARTQFVCNSCGSVHPKWMGKCPDCGTWDSLEEYKAPTPDARRPVRTHAATGDLVQGAEALKLDEIDAADAPRVATGIGEFDRILGGGVVPGSAVLVGGEPGIGKSTLLLQVAARLAGAAPPAVDSRTRRAPKKSAMPLKVMYVSSEESARQTKLRAERLGVTPENLLVLAETNVERIMHQISRHNPDVVVIDSIQMIYKPQVPAAPGSVTQLRDCCMDLVYLAKTTGRDRDCQDERGSTEPSPDLLLPAR